MHKDERVSLGLGGVSGSGQEDQSGQQGKEQKCARFHGPGSWATPATRTNQDFRMSRIAFE